MAKQRMLNLPNRRPSGETHDTGDRGDDGAGSTFGTDNEAKLARLNAIADGADGRREGELEDINDDGTTTAFHTDPASTDEAVDEDAGGDDAASAAGGDDTDASGDEALDLTKVITRKVNGKDVTHTLEDWLTIGQKVESGDEYLRAAAESVKTAATLDLSEEDAPAPIDRKALVRAIQMGTEEEAEQALDQLFEAAKPSKTPDVSQVVEERLTLRDEKAKFYEDYADLRSDPMLWEMVEREDSKLFQADKAEPYSKRWRKAADKVRGWAKSKGLKSVSSNDKAARKAAVAPVPAASGRQVQVDDDDAPDDPESIIANMAKARGQTPVQH